MKRTSLLKRNRNAFLRAAMIAAMWLSVQADHATGESTPSPTNSTSYLLLPYLYYSESMALAFGLGGAIVGWPDEDSAVGAMLTGSANGSFSLLAAGYELPIMHRLLITPFTSMGKYQDLRTYVDGNPDFPDQRAGSNESSPENYLQERTWEAWLNLKFKYRLPFLEQAIQPLSKYAVKQGLLMTGATGAQSWEPLTSGHAYLVLQPEYHGLEIDEKHGEEAYRTLNARFGLEYDTRDDATNPSRGNAIRLSLTRDWGWVNNSDSWTFIDAEISSYIPLGGNRWFRQQVLALDAWTGNSVTWERDEQSDAASSARHKPPYFAGATLGGLYHMRGYPAHRFNDQAVMYYGVEYRMLPFWNPVQEFKPLNDFVKCDWVEYAFFYEMGRVSPNWTLSDMHSNMRWDIGVGVRAMLQKAVVRVDYAYSEEGSNMLIMFGQSF